MSTNKNFDRICIIVTICALIFTCLFMNGEALGIRAVVDEDAESYEGSAYFTAKDQDGTWDTTEAVNITLTGDGADIDGEGVYTYDGDVYISAAGRYLLSGKLNDGSIIVDAYDSSKVFIMLNGVDISCSDDAAFKVEQADKVFLTLAEGTENRLESGAEYSDTALQDEVTGVIHAHDDLTINGNGRLVVTAGYMHGIVAKDDLVLAGGKIEVNAPVDGIRANDSMRIKDAAVSVEAGDDGLVINHEDGYFYMESGTVDVTSEDDAIHAAGDVNIVGGDITLGAADDGIHSDKAFDISGGSVTITECYEGIEALTIDIIDGDLLIYSEDDGLNANGGSGDMFAMGGPGGMGHMMHGDGVSENFAGEAPAPEWMSETGEMPTVEGVSEIGEMPTAKGMPETGETLTAEGMSEMSEALTAEGMPETAEVPAAENGTEESEEEETYVNISGGNLTIINDSGRDADGIDSNGDLIISGGTIRVSLVNNGNNSALDYGSESGGVAEISGGTVVACGSYSMAEHFDSSSTQASILYTYSEGAEAGTTVELEDANGNILLSYEAPQSFSAVNLSCPELEVGGTYMVVIGDMVEEITLDEISASYGDAVSSGFGGSMNFGGMQPGGDRGGRGMRGGSVSSNGEAFEGGMPGGGGPGMSGNGMPGGGGHGMSGNGMPGGGPGMSGNGMPGGAETSGEGEAEETSVPAAAGTALSEFGSDTWLYIFISVIVIVAGIGFAYIYKRRK